MTREEALNLKSFKHYCTCGAFAGISARAASRHPHLEWCPQREEWEEWRAAIDADLPPSTSSGNEGEMK